jgi:hypothetical protein
VPPVKEEVVERVDDCPESMVDGATEIEATESAGLTTTRSVGEDWLTGENAESVTV